MKVVIDSNVIFHAILGKNAKTASKKILERVMAGGLQAYTCDVLIGEMERVIKEDPKLKTIDPIYFQEFVNRLLEWLHFVAMKDLEHNQKMLNEIGNDWYLIAVARNVSAEYIRTYDTHLLKKKAELNSERITIIDSEEFVQTLRLK